MDRALTFDEPYYLGYRILRWNRYHHVHVIGHEMSFFDSALLLLRQAAKYFANGTSRFHRMAAYTQCLRCAGAPRRPVRSGRTMALIGLRMMPTFPLSPLTWGSCCQAPRQT